MARKRWARTITQARSRAGKSPAATNRLSSSTDSAKYVVIGAGVHGLSTAWHLGKELKARGKGSGEDVLLLDKTGIGAGPSGLACGVVRNNYFQPAMRRLMAHSV